MLEVKRYVWFHKDYHKNQANGDRLNRYSVACQEEAPLSLQQQEGLDWAYREEQLY